MLNINLTSFSSIVKPFERAHHREDGAPHLGNPVVHDTSTPILSLSQREDAHLFSKGFKFFELETRSDDSQRHRYRAVVYCSSAPGCGIIRYRSSASLAYVPEEGAYHHSDRRAHEGPQQPILASRLQGHWSFLQCRARSAPRCIDDCCIDIYARLDQSVADSQSKGRL